MRGRAPQPAWESGRWNISGPTQPVGTTSSVALQEGVHSSGKERRAIRHCDSEVWEDPADQPRIVGRLPRAGPLWKRLYRKPMGITRVLRSLKHSRNLEEHCFREFSKAALHTTLSILTYSATVPARLKAGDVRRMRLEIRAPSPTWLNDCSRVRLLAWLSWYSCSRASNSATSSTSLGTLSEL